MKSHFRITKSSKRLHTSEGIWGHLENTLNVFHDYYIPHSGNNHKPKIFHAHSVRAITFSLLALKLALVALVFSVTPVGAWLSPSTESEMLNLTNDYRISLGEPPLVRNSYLDQVAKARAQDMIDRNYFSHYTPEGKKPWQWVDTSQYNYDRFGENLAADFITAKAVLDAFKLSPNHDKNVRNALYRDIGIATVSGQLDGRTTNIMVVFYASLKTPKNPIVIVTPTTTPKSVVVVPRVAKPATKPVDRRLLPPLPFTIQPATTTATTSTGTISDPAKIQVAQVEGVETTIPATEVTHMPTQANNWLVRLFSWSNNFYFLTFIAFLFLAAINIFVKFRVQHHSVIIASIFLIIVAGSLWALSWQGFGMINEVIHILGASLS